jgi:hypothetical protein
LKGGFLVRIIFVWHGNKVDLINKALPVIRFGLCAFVPLSIHDFLLSASAGVAIGCSVDNFDKGNTGIGVAIGTVSAILLNTQLNFWKNL